MTSQAPSPGRSRLEGLIRRGTMPLLLSLAGGLLAGFALNQVLNRAIAGRTEASAFALLARVGPELETVLGSGQSAKEAINRLGRQLSLRATLIGTDGRVLGDSSVEMGVFGDLTLREQAYLLPLVSGLLFCGMYPKPLLELVRPTVLTLLSTVK